MLLCMWEIEGISDAGREMAKDNRERYGSSWIRTSDKR